MTCTPETAREYVSALGLDRRADETPAEQRVRLIAYIRQRAKPKSFADARMNVAETPSVSEHGEVISK